MHIMRKYLRSIALLTLLSASYLLLAPPSQAATYHEGQGCVLERWQD